MPKLISFHLIILINLSYHINLNKYNRKLVFKFFKQTLFLK